MSKYKKNYRNITMNNKACMSKITVMSLFNWYDDLFDLDLSEK